LGRHGGDVGYSIPKEQVIRYRPDTLRACDARIYEWIDDLWFTRSPEEFLPHNATEYVEIARERFLEAGWEGDGDIRLMWIPPFVFPQSAHVPPEGLVIWHVKQVEDGTSFLLSPEPLPFPQFGHREK
jgi:hypothetical protein